MMVRYLFRRLPFIISFFRALVESVISIDADKQIGRVHGCG